MKYKIVPHEKPVMKYGIKFRYKILAYESPHFGWMYMEDAENLKKANTAVRCLKDAEKEVMRNFPELY